MKQQAIKPTGVPKHLLSLLALTRIRVLQNFRGLLAPATD